MVARLHTRYQDEVAPGLMERFGYKNPLSVPKLEKIVVSMGVGDANQNPAKLEAAQKQLAQITGQQPVVMRAKKSVSNFKIRQGYPVGLKVTLRGVRMYEFLDRLISLMGHRGLKFYHSPTPSPIAGPDGIIAANDVILIKINYQWPERGGTNTDLLRGLIRRIVDHPDTFTGEIVVGENTQFQPTDNFDRPNNNAQDHGLSPQDVINEFQAQGYTISRKSWRLLRYTQVEEYSAGDMTDGYVVYPYDPQLDGRVSYPKFQSNDGTYISVRHGLWDSDSGTYDREHLKLINVPVLKSHHASYGATACVKNYMGVVTANLDTNSHDSIRYGILGALLGEIQLADLNILDCIWINANPDDGPRTSYEAATRRDELVASTDPVAVDIWAVTNILIPGFIENGHLPPWPEPSADPNDPTSDFREYLDNSMSWILAAGYQVTNDPDQIDVFTWDGAGDVDADGDVDLSDLATLLAAYNTCAGDPTYNPAADFDGDGCVGLADLAVLLAHYGLGT